MMNKTYYGGFRNMTFSDVYENYEQFLQDYSEIGLPKRITDESLRTTYILICSRYGQSTITHNSMLLFKQSLFSLIYMYGPAWEKRIELQDKIIKMDFEKVARLGNTVIHNHATNDSRTPDTETTEAIPFIDDQNTSLYKKGELEAIAQIEALLKTDVTLEYLDKFSRLFSKIVAPDYPLLYSVGELITNMEGV